MLPAWPAFDEKKNPGAMALGDKVEPGPVLSPAQIAFFHAFYEQQNR